MKNFIFFSLLIAGLMLTSCSAIQIITEPGTETTPSKTPTTPKTTKKTNKVVLKPTAKKPSTKPRETSVIKKPVAKKPTSGTGSSKSGKIIKKPSKKPNNQSISQKKKVTKPTASRTKQAVKVVKEAPNKKVVKKVQAPKKKVVVHAKPAKKVVATSKTTQATKRPIKKVKEKVAQITLDQPKYDFGTIKEGTIIKRDFRFTNTGAVDLVIEIATGSCGCTVPEWPAKPIKPGQSEVIEVTFDSTDKEYDTRVEANIVANTEPIVTEIILTGKVIPKRDFKKKKQ